MPNPTSPKTTEIKRWQPAMRFFHWVMALLILLAIALGFLANEWDSLGGERKQQYLLFMVHKSIGLTILFLAIGRVITTVSSRAPTSLTTHSPLEKKAARIAHRCLYIMMFALPLSGWWLNSIAGVPLKYFLLWKVPSITAAQPSLESLAALIHVWLAMALIAIICLHIGGAIKHHWIDRDETLARMFPTGKTGSAVGFGVALLLATALLSGGYSTLRSFSEKGPSAIESEHHVKANPDAQRSNALTATPTQAVGPESFIVLPESELAFTVDVLGQKIGGTFKNFDANIVFDPASPESGSFDVTINTASAFTDNSTRDEMLPEPNWFSAALFPTAQFKTLNINAQETGYIARSELTIRGVTQTIDFVFLWEESDSGSASLTANTLINRMDFNIGADEFPDTETVGHKVNVMVTLKLQKSSQSY